MLNPEKKVRLRSDFPDTEDRNSPRKVGRMW